MTTVNRTDLATTPRFQRYPTYKDSGVQWLGPVPATWKLRPLWTMYRRVKRVGHQDLELLSVYRDHGVVPTSSRDDNFNQPSEDLATYQLVETGDLVTNKMKAWQGSIAISRFTGIVSPAYHVYAPHSSEVDSYIHYLLRSSPYIASYMRISKGIRVNQWDLEAEAFSRIPILLPSREEQRAIATVLDRETARIDELVAKKERLIELLQERRTALITQAVTKGLRPSAPTKDSGVEWLGEVPAHWEVMRTKHAALLRTGHTPSRQHPEYWVECEIPWFGLADVWQIRDGHVEYVTETAEKISELGLANSAARLLPKGTVMLSRTASVGFSVIMGVDMATTQDFVNWVCREKLRPEYLLYVFRSMHQEFQRLTMGSTHQTIYMPAVGQFSTPIPPVQEQDQIVTFIRHEASGIDALVIKVRDAIDRLKEYRTSLISAAVTGQVDVRGEVA